MKKIIVLILLIATTDAFSQEEISRVGTSGAQFLKIGVGARACGMGENAVALRGDPATLFWNVAGIASVEKKSFVISRNELYLDLGYNFLGFVLPIHRNASLGFSLLYFNSGEMEVTTVDQPEGTGQFFNWQSYCFGLSFSQFVTDRLSLGGTVKFIREGTFSETSRSLAFDLGALLDTGVLGFRLGLSMSNIGGKMRFSNIKSPDVNPDETGFQEIIAQKSYLQTQDYPLPLTFRLGISTDLLGKNSRFLTDQKNRLTFSMSASDPNDAFMSANFGFEYEWNAILSLRAGYRGMSIEGSPLQGYQTAGYTFGVGVKYEIEFVQLNLDYAFMDFKVLGNSQHITLGINF